MIENILDTLSIQCASFYFLWLMDLLLKNCVNFLQKHRLIMIVLMLIIPYMLVYLQEMIDKKSKLIKYIMLLCYVAIILCCTIIGRTPGKQLINLHPFWSYALWTDSQFKWQIIMNVCLFIPFGFLMSYCTKWRLLTIAFWGFSFAIVIESVQYFYSLGYCEFDDVFNNTLGTLIGFGYWKCLIWVERKYGNTIKEFVLRYIRRVCGIIC